MEYRTVSREEIVQLHELDRTETIDRVYYVDNGKLCLREEHWDVGEWSAEEKQRRIAELQAGYDAGDTLFGAFDGPTLVGLSVLDQYTSKQVAGRFNLAGLWVSALRILPRVSGTSIGRLSEKRSEAGGDTVDGL